MACGLCGLEPRYGDNLALVRVMPGQPHWDALAENEPPGQSSISVPACFDCRSEFSVDYFGLPAEMLGERPWAKPSQCCRLCKIPFRQGDWPPILRILKDDPRYEALAKGEPPEQTSIGVYVCKECREREIPAYTERRPEKIDLHLV